MKTTIRSMSLAFAAVAPVCFALVPDGQGAPPPPANADNATRGKVGQSYGKLPLSFEANQQNGEVKFLSRGSGYNLFLTDGEAVLVLSKPEKPAPAPERKAIHSTLAQKSKRQSTVLRTQLIAANQAGKVTGEEELPGKVNYFVGRDPEQWRTGVTTYARVRYQEIYPDIDLVYYGNQGQLEYDFVVRPGADPARIRLRVAGARKMYVNDKGQLVLQTAGGAVHWNKPSVYQQAGDGRQGVKGKYVLRRGHEVGFEVAAYDTAKPLIIDPTLVYSTYIGGSRDDYDSGIAVDTSGNAYITGYTYSDDFPTTPGAFQTTKNDDKHLPSAFVTKVNPTGSALVYSTYLGGSGLTNGRAIAVDASGNAYVTGDTSSSDFPTTPGAFQATKPGIFAAFVTELNPTGSDLVYSTFLGGSDSDDGNGIAADASGNAYVTGDTYSGDFPTTPGAFQTTWGGSQDAFVTELNPTGSALLYSTYLGGSDFDYGSGIVVDISGDAYITGHTHSTDFPTTDGAFQRTNLGGYSDVFVTEINPTGSALLYSTYLGGRGILGSDAGNDVGIGIALNTSGNAYVTGLTNSSDFPTTPGAFQTTNNSTHQVAIVTQLNLTGTSLVYSTYLGGSGAASAYGIAVDTSGNAYVMGYTGSDFPTTAGAFQTTFGGGAEDAFVTELNPTGSALVYSTYLGGSSDDFGFGIALDTSGNAYVTGRTESRDFPATTGAFQATNHGGRDAFVAKFETASQIVLTATRRQMGGVVSVRLDWTGATSTKVDIYRDGVQIARVRNNGRYKDSLTVSGTYVYKVCEVGGAMDCSNEVTVNGPK